jgi:hypothetical protein
MPIKRRLAKRRTALTVHEAGELLGQETSYGFAQSRGDMRAAWEDHRDDLLRYWVFGDPSGCSALDDMARRSDASRRWLEFFTDVREGGHPGTRPWMWWCLDAPTAGVSGIDDDGKLIAPPWPDAPPGPDRNTRCGFPHLAYDNQISDALRYSDPLPLFESEAAYLKRHGLLLPGELERLTTADFEPRTFEPQDVDDAEQTECDAQQTPRGIR